MKRFTQTLPILLAALLQMMPLIRSVITNPAALSSLAFIIRWGVGTGLGLEAVDAVSGATSAFTNANTFSGSVGTPFNANIVVSIGGGNSADSSDYFVISAGSTSSPLLKNLNSTTVGMPPGLTFESDWTNNARTIGGFISGTPTTAGTYPFSVTCVSPGNAQLSQAITITISGVTTPTAPAITMSPAPTNVIAGRNANFTVTASGTAPLEYFWLKDGNPLANAGNVTGANTASLAITAVTTNDAANYSVIVSNTAGTATSSVAPLTIIVPPVITVSPGPQTVTNGDNANFSVTATGSAPLAYRWLKDDVTIGNGTTYSGVSTSLLTVSAAGTAEAGNYSVAVTNLAGGITSSVAPLTVLVAAAITASPMNLSVVTGASAAFTVTATGSAPLFYRWLKNGSPLMDGGNVMGSATATLNLSSVSTNDAVGYSVIVSNSLNTVTSAVAWLTVTVPPEIVVSPVDDTLIAGSNVTFTVTASGTGPLNYQWLKNGTVMADGGNISGAATSALTLANVSATDAASYSVTVTNAAGSATSGAAMLTVLVPPAITAQPAPLTVAQGSQANFMVSASGTAPLSFQWLLGGNNIPGATSNVLTLSSVSTNDMASYSVAVTNMAGSVTSSAAALVVSVPPTIIAGPVDVSATAGSNVSFTVMAGGSFPLTYAWLKNGTALTNGGNVSGVNTSTLMLSSIGGADAANYSVTASNSAGAVTSLPAILTVLFSPAIVTQPVNQFGAVGAVIQLSVVASGTSPLTYQWFNSTGELTDGVSFTGSDTSTLMIASLSTNEADNYHVVVSNAVGSVTSLNASVSINSSPAILVSPVSENVARSNSVLLTVTASGSGPLAYRWRKNGTNLLDGGIVSGSATAALTLANVNTNNSGNYLVVVTNIYGSATSAVAVLNVEIPPGFGLQPTNKAARTGTNVVFVARASGTGLLGYQWFKNGLPMTNGGNISGSFSNVLAISNLTTTDAAAYYVTASNAVGLATSASAALTVWVPPSMVTQPTNQNIVVSNTVTFAASATGTSPLRFQWRKAGVVIAHATNAVYSLAVVKTADAGVYSVVVTNRAGSVTSANANLTVFVVPKFTLQASNRVVKLGTNTVFRTAIAGTAPLIYQWYKDGSPLVDGGNIFGSQSNVLTVAAQGTNDGGAYSLAVTNLAGGLASSNAVLLVLVPPAIATEPANEAVAISNSVTFSVTATGSALCYQWHKGAATITGATNSFYSIAQAKTTDAAGYSVWVTNRVGRVVSSNAVLSVVLPPMFTLQASNRTVQTGSNTIFKAKVKGASSFVCQWYKDGNPLTNGGNISGALTTNLVVAQISLLDAGIYSLSVSNLAASITSSNAVLTLFTQNSVSAIAVAKTAPNITLTLPPRFTQILRNVDGSFTLAANGLAGSNYVLQVTVNFDHWTALQTNMASVDGSIQFTDPDSVAPVKFYRLTLP